MSADACRPTHPLQEPEPQTHVEGRKLVKLDVLDTLACLAEDMHSLAGVLERIVQALRCSSPSCAECDEGGQREPSALEHPPERP